VIDFNADSTNATNTGQAIVAIDPAAFGDPEAFRRAVDQVIRDLRNSARMPGVERIWMPGEQSHERIAANRRDGIPLAPGVMAGLDRVAQELDLAPLRTN